MGCVAVAGRLLPAAAIASLMARWLATPLAWDRLLARRGRLPGCMLPCVADCDAGRLSRSLAALHNRCTTGASGWVGLHDAWSFWDSTLLQFWVDAMSADEIVFDAEARMEKAVQVLKQCLAGIRTGRANPGLVDSLRVEVYGAATPIKQLATVGSPEPTQIVIRPYDPNTIKDIEKAIIASDLGFNPQNDGRLIRINVPPLSNEQRKKMVARIKDLTEEAKVAIRNIRRDANKALDLAEKAKEMSEDERDGMKEEIQEATKKHEAQAGESAKKREADVME